MERFYALCARATAAAMRFPPSGQRADVLRCCGGVFRHERCIEIALQAIVLLLILGALLFAGQAAAQRGSEMTRAAALLPPDSRAIVGRLATCASCPPAYGRCMRATWLTAKT